MFIKLLNCVRLFIEDTNVKGRNVFTFIIYIKRWHKNEKTKSKLGEQIKSVSLEKKR